MWATGAGFINGEMFSFNYGQGLELLDGENTGDYFKLGDKLVLLEPMMMNFDENNISKTLKLETHPNFKNSEKR